MKTKELAKLINVTPRQLQWWDEKGLVTPGHVRRDREYSKQDVQQARAIAICRSAGISLQAVRKLRELHETDFPDWVIRNEQRLRLLVSSESEAQLVSTAVTLAESK